MHLYIVRKELKVIERKKIEFMSNVNTTRRNKNDMKENETKWQVCESGQVTPVDYDEGVRVSRWGGAKRGGAADGVRLGWHLSRLLLPFPATYIHLPLLPPPRQ